MTALVVRGDAACLPLPDGSVDLVVTSPPYWSLRSYQDGGSHYDGQLGSEPTPGEFIAALLDCTREWVRVLKPAGSIFVNLGDKYNAYNGGRGPGTIQTNDIRQDVARGNGLDVKGVKPKSLLGLPWRYAIGCIDQLGLILRAEIIWDKPNGLPESVTDRVRRSHEQWFHMVKQPRYFAAVDEIREVYNPKSLDRYKSTQLQSLPAERRAGKGDGYIDGNRAANPLGKLPGSVWTIASEPLTVPDHLGVDHFAAFPTEWPRRIIQGWSPSGICVECGEGRRPVSDREFVGEYNTKEAGAQRARSRLNGGTARVTLGRTDDILRTITGYVCACPTPNAPTRPSLVLDPFGGTGTTALCATMLGRIGVTVDLSHDYSRLAQWRTTDPASRAKAMRVEKPPVEAVGQADLFGGAACTG